MTSPARVGYMPSVAATVEWATPQPFFDALDAEFHFTLDPCATPENAKCARFFTEAIDGLAQDWGRETVFCNPPYGPALRDWVAKCAESARGGGNGRDAHSVTDRYPMVALVHRGES